MVLDPAETFERDAVWLDGVELELLSQVQGPSKVTPFADKITVGESSRASDPVLSSWILEDFTGGLGVLNMDAERQADRYRMGSLWALNPKNVRLGARPTPYPLGVPPGKRPRGMAAFGGADYCAFDQQVRFLATTTGTWTTPTEPGYVDLQAPATALVTLRLAGKDWLMIADGNGILSFNGAVWAYQFGGGPAGPPLAQFLTEWDDELYVLDVNGGLWRTANGTSWTAIVGVPVLAGDCRGLDVFFDEQNNPTLHVPTRSGLWQYVAQDEVFVRTRLRWPRHPQGGDGHAVWRDEYYESAGLDMYHYTGQQVSPLSLNRDDGLPADYLGSISALLGLLNWLVVAVNGDTVASFIPKYRTATARFTVPRMGRAAGRSALYLWTGSAFQPLWLAAQNGQPVTWISQSSATGVATIWWSDGQTPLALKIGNGLQNPAEIPVWAYQPSGWLESSRFDGNWIEQPKLAVRTVVRAEAVPAGAALRVYRRVDRTTPWCLVTTLTAPGLVTVAHEQNAGAVDGLPWYEWEYRAELDGAPDGATPVLVFIKLEYVRVPAVRWGYRFQARVVADRGGLTPEQQFARLVAAAGAPRLVPFVYRSYYTSPVTRRCLITSFAATGQPGGETQQLVNIALEEA